MMKGEIRVKVLIIIPAYNEEDNIEKVVSNLKQNYPQYDYLIVNDASKDNTEMICEKNGYNYVTLPVNLGIGGGVQTGYMYAKLYNYDVAIQMDGDGQHNPAYIEQLIAPIALGECDMTVGSRFIEKKGFQTSFMRRLGINIIRLVIKICCDINITDTTSGFRAASRDLICFFADNYAQDYPEPEAIVSSVLNGYVVKEVPVIMNERQGGISSISGLKSLYYMVKVSLALVIHRLKKY